MIYLLSVFLEFRLRVQTIKAQSETIGVVVKGKQNDVMTDQEDCESRVLGNACEFYSWDSEVIDL